MLAVLAASAALLSPSPSPQRFDARTPQAVLTGLQAAGMTGEMKSGDDGAPWIAAKAGSLGFNIEFYGCDDSYSRCKAVAYQATWDFEEATLDQVNRWNRWTLGCPANLSPAKRLQGWYVVRPAAGDTPEEVVEQQKAWAECLGDLDAFANAPEAFLAAVER